MLSDAQTASPFEFSTMVTISVVLAGLYCGQRALPPKVARFVPVLAAVSVAVGTGLLSAVYRPAHSITSQDLRINNIWNETSTPCTY